MVVIRRYQGWKVDVEGDEEPERDGDGHEVRLELTVELKSSTTFRDQKAI